MAMLDEQLNSVVKNTEPRIVAVVGEGGVGKSRLMSEFRARHDHGFSDLLAVRGYPEPGGESSDRFVPFGRLLRNCFRVDEQESPEMARARVRARITELDPPSRFDAMRALGYFLGVRFPDEVPEALEPAAPEEQRRRAFALYAWYLRQLGARQPLLVLIEGLDRASPDALDLLAYLKHHLDDCAVLILCELGRGQFESDPAWFQRFGHGVLEVDRLDEASAGTLLQKMTDRANPPPRNLMEAVMEATGGLPGRLAQVAERLVSHGVVEPEKVGWGIDPDEPVAFDFPLTDEQAARHRLERLEPEGRALLARAAVVGRVFWRGSLVPLARLQSGVDVTPDRWIDLPDRGALDDILDRAEDLGILHLMADSGFTGEAEYAFTRVEEHAILLDSVDAADRESMHAMVAQWLEYKAQEMDAGRLMEIAAHYQSGGNEKRAAFYFIQAGDAARRSFANDAAVVAFERAVGLMDHRDGLTLMDVLHALGALHALAGRHDRAEACFERMLGLAWILDHRAKAGAALNRLGRLYRSRGLLARARVMIEHGRDLFARADDGPGVAASIDDLGQVALRSGRRDEALRLFTEALEYRRVLGDARSIALSLTNVGRLQRENGYLEAARITLNEALELRQRIGDTAGVISSRIEQSELSLRRGEIGAARAAVEEAVRLAEDIGDVGETARGRALSALIAAEEGRLEAARRYATEAGALADQLGDMETRVRALRAVAMVQLGEGHPDVALELMMRVSRLARAHTSQRELGVALRLQARLRATTCGVALDDAAAVARSLAEEAEPSASVDSSIHDLIDDALGSHETRPPVVTSLEKSERAALDEALEIYADALHALEEAGDDAERVEALREMATLAEATGDVPRGRLLRTRAEDLEEATIARAEAAIS
jgi:tetratricopeptide (TPR) repeat protein